MDAAEKKGDWNEEYDARLELIEDHLKNVRRILVAVLIVMIVLAISSITLTWLLIYTILPPAVSL